MTSTGVFLKSLTVRNYLFFSRNITLDFCIDSTTKRNLVLVGGVNGAGKTSLLNAIKYTITGRLTPEEARRLYSENATDSKLFFNLCFTWKGGSYRLTRVYDKNNDFFKSSTLEYDDGKESEEQRIQESIDTIFPPNLLDLFFFDVEEVKGLLTKENAGGEIKQQIERLLGIEIVRQAQQDALTLVRENDVSKDGKIVSVPHVEAEISAVEQQLQDMISGIQEAQILQDNLEKKLSSMPSSTNAQRIEAELNAKKREVDQASQRLNELRDEGISHIGRAFVYELLWPLVTQYESEDATRDQEQLELFDRDKVVAILQDKQAEISALGLTFEQAEKLIDLIVGDSKSELPELKPSYQRVKIEVDTANNYGKTSPQLLGSIDDQVRRRERLRQEVERFKVDLQQQQGDSEQRKFIEGYLKETKEKLKRLTDHKGDLDKAKSDFLQQLQTAREQGQEHEQKRSREGVAQLYVEVFSKMLEIGRRSLLGSLGEKATEIFRSIDNDPHLYGEVFFNNSYQPRLRRGGQDWDPTNLSQGHQTIFAYSILGALMQLSGHSLPAVIDTPMMKLDSVHKSNVVSRLYPSLSHQVILFSSDEEVDDVYYPQLRPFVAKNYIIKQQDITVGHVQSKSSYVEEGYFDFVGANL